jgi:hypothetical protein
VENQAGGGEPPSLSDVKLWEQALRQDWPIPQKVKTRILQAVINLADPADEEPIPARSPEDWNGYDLDDRIDLTAKRDRTKIAASRVVAQFGRLSIEQQKLDLAREKAAPGAALTPAAGGRLDVAAMTDDELERFLTSRGA